MWNISCITDVGVSRESGRFTIPAIAAVHIGFSDDTTVSNNPVIVIVLKRLFNIRPLTKKLAPSWSINDVLTTLAVGQRPLELLTLETPFLVTAASARGGIVYKH